jgi:hypothetical protein
MPTFNASGRYAALSATVALVTVAHKSIDSSVVRSSRCATSRYGKTNTCPEAYGYAFKIAKERLERWTMKASSSDNPEFKIDVKTD